jgi:hypothetical protein
MSHRLDLSDDTMRELAAAILVVPRSRCHRCGTRCATWYCRPCHRVLSRRRAWLPLLLCGSALGMAAIAWAVALWLALIR